MTKLERVELKKLLAEAKDKESNEGQGEWLFEVRGNPGSMRIVKLKKIHALTHLLQLTKLAYYILIWIVLLIKLIILNNI